MQSLSLYLDCFTLVKYHKNTKCKILYDLKKLHPGRICFSGDFLEQKKFNLWTIAGIFLYVANYCKNTLCTIKKDLKKVLQRNFLTIKKKEIQENLQQVIKIT